MILSVYSALATTGSHLCVPGIIVRHSTILLLGQITEISQCWDQRTLDFLLNCSMKADSSYRCNRAAVSTMTTRDDSCIVAMQLLARRCTAWFRILDLDHGTMKPGPLWSSSMTSARSLKIYGCSW